MAARRMIEALSYEGARQGRREEGWRVSLSTSANAEISGDRLVLRDRVRALRRNNPWARKAIAVLVSNRIGTGILASADGPNQRINRRLNEQWEEWGAAADYSGKTDIYGIQALAETARIESGECFIRRIRSEDMNIRFQLQVVEADLLDTTRNERLANGVEVREGIEYAGGRPSGYYLYPSHPGDSSPTRISDLRSSSRVPASEVIHYYRVERPGQLSGVSELAPVIRRLYDLDGYADAELMRKKIAACSLGAVTTPTSLPAASLAPTELASDGSGKRVEQFQPGMWHYLKPGENVQFFDPKPSEGYDEFFGVELHAIAAGLNVPYELLTGDLSEVNYTSHRGGLVQFRASVEADQWQLVIPQLCERIWSWFVQDYALPLPAANIVPATFTPPRFGLLDPAKEIPAMIEAIRGGLQSWQTTIRREGDDPMKVLDELQEERREFERRGITVTSIEAPAPPPAEDSETADEEIPEGDEEDEAA